MIYGGYTIWMVSAKRDVVHIGIKIEHACLNCITSEWLA